MNELFVFLQENMATKDDIADIRRDFATKDDLKGFATKDDLRAFATKDDLKAFATKDDLRSMRDELMTHLDGIVKRFVDFEQELIFLRARTDRHNEALGLA